METMETLDIVTTPKKIDEPTKKVAIFVRRLDNWRGNAELYQMCPAWDNIEYLILSSVDNVFDLNTSETMGFASNPQGNTDFVDVLRFNPAKTHRSALYSIGYTQIK